MKQLITPTTFEVGQYYTNDQIHYALEVANLGGIRPKLNSQNELDFIVVVTSSEENKKAIRNPYADRIEGNVLTYTGAGLKGEQAISGVNKRLLEQVDNPIPILGFVKEAVNQYKFVGFLFLLRHYEDYQLDHEGAMRKVYVFEFQIIPEIPALNVGGFKDIFAPVFSKLKEELTEGDTVVESEINKESVVTEIDQLKDVERLKSKLMVVDPYKFEIVVSNLITHVGFSDVKVTKKSGDEGVDVNAILKNPVSTNLKYLFQVKRWKHSVGRNEVANLRGSMGLNNQGVIISTSHFTTSAINEAGSEYKTPINLVGIKELHSIIDLTKFQIDEFIM
jgi:hypothetical protein